MDLDLKKKGARLLTEGYALVDTSGRTKNLTEKSVLALASNKINFTVLFSASEKKKIFDKLVKRGISEERAKAIMHSTKLYYAIRNSISNCPGIYICCDGFDSGLLKQYLKLLMGTAYHEGKINFERSLKAMFTKKNIADRLAFKVNKDGKKPNLILLEKHFKELNLV